MPRGLRLYRDLPEAIAAEPIAAIQKCHICPDITAITDTPATTVLTLITAVTVNRRAMTVMDMS